MINEFSEHGYCVPVVDLTKQLP